jgi:hypothetical protein
MDTKILVKKLHKIFCDIGKDGKLYSKVWLDPADFGGLYHTDMFILNVRAHHEIDNCFEEIADIIQILDQRAKEELQFIWRVAVYRGGNEEIHCASNLLVFEEENTCS